MSEVMKEIGSIGKSQTNTQQGFKFRGIDQFVNALYPALTKHGVFMIPRCVEYKHELKDVTRSNGKAGVDKHVHILMEYNFYAKDGSTVTVGPVPGEALDSSDKSTNKALSAALKYALIQTFSIPTVDMEEADSTSPVMGTSAAKDKNVDKPSPSQTQKTLADLAPEAGIQNTKVAESAVGASNNIQAAPEAQAAEQKKSFRKPAAEVKGWT